MALTIARVMRIPNVTEETAAQVLAVMRGEKPVEDFKSVQEWVHLCYHRPSSAELKMCAINELLNGHGVESVFSDGNVWPDFSYVNMGDTYIETMILEQHGERNNGKWRVGCWGDLVEEMEQRREDSLDEEQ